jgi:hypothetical protein
MKQNYLILFLLTALGFAACKKEKSNEPEIQTQNVNQFAKWDATAKTVAQDVSQKLNSVHFRKMLKHEVCLRFDGDANILISSFVKRLPVYLEYERNQQLTRRGESLDTLLSMFNFDILQQAAANFPQMQIAVQTDAESWDAATFVPKVVYLTSDYDESTHTSVNGFDANQNPILVSTLVDPTDNHVVISQNERTILRTNDVLRIRNDECIVEELMATATYNPEALPDPIIPCPGGGGGGTGGGGGGNPPPYIQYIGIGQDGVLPTLVGTQMGTIVPPPPSGTYNRLQPVGTFNGTTVYRKDFKHEKMRKIRCDDLGEIEGWPAGAPEIRMHVFEQNVLNPSENLQIYKEEFKPNKRKDINGKWWDCPDYTMHLWDYQGTGTKSSFGYYEYDPVLIPNEALVAIGQIVVDILTITSTIPTGNPTQVAIYGSIRQSVATGIRSLKKKNGMSEYIGKDDYSIFNDEDQFNHSPGETKFKTWPDL